ncbi:MAG: HD domain-containing protein [Bacillota bacterium]|nr:HD domain-containing protein [Bacillota bacterium]
MKKLYYINDLRTEDELQDFFLIKTIAIKLGSNKKQYLDLLLADCTGEITAKKWDISDEELPSLNEIKGGDIVKVKAQVTEWNGLRQLRIQRIRKAADTDELEMADYIKAAPEKPEDMFGYIEQTANGMKDQELKNLCMAVLEEKREKLMYYPAAMKNHHAELGGLLYHTKRMLELGRKVCEIYKNLNRDLVLAGVILHDMEKVNEIESNELGVSTGYSFEGQLLGHLIQGIKNIERVGTEQGMDREKLIMVEHMILSHHYEPEFGSPKRPLFPEAEILHYLDMIDARMYDMEDVLKSTDRGEFSDKVWTLDNRRLYRPREEKPHE